VWNAKGQVLLGVFWVITMFSYIQNLQFLQFAGFGSVLFGLPPVAVKAWRTVRRYEFDANCMMLTAAIGALCLGELDEAASVSFLFAVSEFLEARASYKARMALQAICQLQPEHAHVMHPVTRQLTVLPAHAVAIGSWLCVRTGDRIATDGIVIEGSSQVDESSLTGESRPLDKAVNDKVAGGTMNIGSTPLIVQTTSTSEDSAVSRLIRLVEEAQAHTSPTEKMIDAFARAYTPTVLAVAAICCTIPWFWGSEVGRYWTLNGLIIIVIACPCALTISTPVTYAAALAATAQRGIIVKGGGDCLETLGSVETVLLDKTGTITQGKFQILHLQEIGDFKTRREMLELLALLEGQCSHPISATLVKAAQEEAGTLSSTAAARRVENHCILTGEGVTGVVDGQHVYVGNVRLFERLGMYQALPTAYQGLAQEWNMQGGSVGFVGVSAPTRISDGGDFDDNDITGGICGILRDRRCTSRSSPSLVISTTAWHLCSNANG
jgi:Zn2+/Cd2+-exporting ATPase